jgi:hypothetical protein
MPPTAPRAPAQWPAVGKATLQATPPPHDIDGSLRACWLAATRLLAGLAAPAAVRRRRLGS